MPEAHRGQSVRAASIAPCFRGIATYTDIDGADYQILVEADFLVNLYEDDVNRHGIEQAYQQIFRTQTGKEIFNQMYTDER